MNHASASSKLATIIIAYFACKFQRVAEMGTRYAKHVT